MPDKPGLMLVLHAHLPFVRHPEFDTFLEENWLFEAITECYLPIIAMLMRLEDKGIPGKLSLTVTPTLAAMLADEMLLGRYLRRLENLVELSEKELERTARCCPEFSPAANHYHERFTQMHTLFTQTIRQDIIEVLKKFQRSGRLDIYASAATHGLLPLLACESSIKAQIASGIKSHQNFFGAEPKGFWIPECAYTPYVGDLLAGHGVQYTITDSHAILHGTPRPKYGVYAPVRTPSGLFAFARDPESSKQVWSADTGYPGDPQYREFYRDLGWDADMDYIQPYLVSHELRHDLGFKYHRITGSMDLSEKRPYQPGTAAQKAAEHARHFISSRLEHAQRLHEQTGRYPLFVAPYDAELFGHWWYEGPLFLEELFTAAQENGLEIISAAGYIKNMEMIQSQQPVACSWGYKGYLETWLNGSNDWIYPPLHLASSQMHELACGMIETTSQQKRLLNQAAREVLLAQSSDWPFIMTTGTMTEYATRRFKGHLEHFCALRDMLLGESEIDEEYLIRLEGRNNIFPDMDYTVFRG